MKESREIPGRQYRKSREESMKEFHEQILGGMQVRKKFLKETLMKILGESQTKSRE